MLPEHERSNGLGQIGNQIGFSDFYVKKLFLESESFDDFQYFRFAEPINEIVINGRRALVFSGETGYCDAGLCGGPFTAYTIEGYDNSVYEISFFNQELTETQKRIRDSLKILAQ